MKTTLNIIIAAIAGILFTACATTAGAKPYPLTTCIVTGNALSSMGDEQSLVYNGQTIKFCCQPCVDKFRANPAKYLAKMPK